MPVLNAMHHKLLLATNNQAKVREYISLLRDVSFELVTLAELGITTIEDDITLDELIQADEAFLTNSVMEIMPLTAVDGKPISSGTSGEITRKLMGAYKDLVRGEVG